MSARPAKRLAGLPAFELVEEAVQLLRLAPPRILVTYYAGAVPFVLALLYFWADMSRGAQADGRCASGALLLALLFVPLVLVTATVIIGVFAIIVLFGMCFSSLSMALAPIFRTRERMMGIGQAITMPLFFASNAIYPIAVMPKWLQVVSHINPLTYEVDALRALMLSGGSSTYGLGLDFAVLVVATALLILIAGRLYPKVAI